MPAGYVGAMGENSWFFHWKIIASETFVNA
jgi:hypothetical protein